MNNSTYRFTLDLQKHNSQKSIAVFKYDNAVMLYIGLTDGGKPYKIEAGSYAIFYGKRADGKALIHKCDLKDDAELIYAFRNSTAYVGGVVDCQIRIYDGEDKLITAPRFTIMVEERVIDEDDIEIKDSDALAGIDDIFNNEYNRQLKEAARDIAENGVFDQDGTLVTPGRVQAEEAREQAEKERKSVWVRYSAYYDGKNSSDKWAEGMDYIGVALSHDEPTDNNQYTWMLFKGTKGDQGIQGEKGEPFRVVKQYPSFVDMRDDFDNAEITSGSFVMIVTKNPDEVDNGKLYCKGDDSWNYITDMSGVAGIKGEQGLPGKDGVSVTHSWEGTKLTVTSASGTSSVDLKGEPGARGYSAYEIAKAKGYQGSEDQWVASLPGKDGINGASAYEIAKAKGYQGSEDQWVASLQGKDGTPGKSAYLIARETTPYDIGSASDWVESLKGADGTNGADGKSAYEIAKEKLQLEIDEDTWVKSLHGTNGVDGKSAYEIAKKYDETLESEAAWLASLHGTNGEDGKSAYEIAQKYDHYESESAWLASLHGKKGDTGVGIKSIEQSFIATEDGGTNIVTINTTDGGASEVHIKNGSTGAGIESIEQTTVETEADSTNIVKITTTDGKTSEIQIKNGKNAYQVACDNGFEGSEADWVAFLNGAASQIVTTNGKLLRFFVGTQEEYDKETSKEFLFGLITDDETKNKFEKVYGGNGTEGLAYGTAVPAKDPVTGETYYIDKMTRVGETACYGIGKARTKDIVISTTHEGDLVTQVGLDFWTDGYTFRNTDIITVKIPYSVQFISEMAFSECKSLREVEISSTGNSLFIDQHAFANCEELSVIDLPDRVGFIGDYAFQNCTSLSSFMFPRNVVDLGHGILMRSGVKSITFRAAPTFIPISVCKDCKNLKSVTIDKGVQTIGSQAFEGCTALTGVTLPISVTDIYSYAFNGCTALNNITIPKGVTSIGSYAFYNCTGLPNIIIPESVTSIGLGTFKGCTNLTNMTLPFIGATKDGTENTHLGYIFGANTYLGNATDIPANLHTIVVNGNTSIGNYAFYDCKGLTSVTIEDGVTGIGDYAFYGCTGLPNITIPKSVKSIGDYAFYGCTILPNVTIPESVKSIGDYAFYDCKILNNITISKGVTSIGESAFYNCTSLPNVTIPESVTTISDSAFYGCRGLKSVTISNGVENINSNAFRGCSSLETVNIPSSVKGIGNQAFSECRGLKTVTIENGVLDIGDLAFCECPVLNHLTIPKSVLSISDNAFYMCRSLTSINYLGTKEDWKNIIIWETDYSNKISITVKCTDGDLTFNKFKGV